METTTKTSELVEHFTNVCTHKVEHARRSMDKLKKEMKEKQESENDWEFFHFLRWKINSLFKAKARLDFWTELEDIVKTKEFKDMDGSVNQITDEERLDAVVSHYKRHLRNSLQNTNLKTDVSGHGIEDLAIDEERREFVNFLREELEFKNVI